MGNFLKDLKTGGIGESIVLSFLKNQENTLDVIDVRDVKFFRDSDIDFVQVVDNQLFPRLVEVKTDSMAHRTGNIAYEYISNHRIKSIGCFEKTQSTHIFYYLSVSKRLYVIDTKCLQNYVKNNKDNLKLIPMGDNARGYLLKINTLIENGFCWDLKTIDTELNKGESDEV